MIFHRCKIALLALLLAVVVAGLPTNVQRDAEKTAGTLRASRALHPEGPSSYHTLWHDKAQNTLKKILARRPNTSRAKSVIMFLGDGMSVATVSAARVLGGQRLGLAGEEYSLAFEEFPYTGLSKTYCVDKQVADSACSATAYLGGVKTNYATIGVTSKVKKQDCVASLDPNNQVESIAVWAQRAGKATGIVTTTRVTHASPAGTYGHTSNRDFESDYDIVRFGGDDKICVDLATQLMQNEPGINLKVIMGGGRSKFLPNTTVDEEGMRGERLDGQNLIQAWNKDKLSKGASAAYVTDRKGLLATPSSADYLLGLFDGDHMQFNMDANPETEPTLAEMTEAAIKILAKEENGFFLFVEGGKIDIAHHDNLAHKALDETIEFAKAVKMAEDMTGEDTLIVVTADHAHTMSFSGYGDRGTDILAFAGMGKDNLPYPKLSYANGPSYKPQENGRYNLTNDDYRHPNYTFLSPVPLSKETHGGEDVQVFAKGPWSHLFSGAYEQHLLPHLMAFASCIGNGRTACEDPKEDLSDNDLHR